MPIAQVNLYESMCVPIAQVSLRLPVCAYSSGELETTCVNL